MSEELDDQVQNETEDGPDGPDTVSDLLTGEVLKASKKNLLVQKVLRQMIESYGFDRKDLRKRYRLSTKGKRKKVVDIAILRHGEDACDENVERIVVCENQKAREKLRSVEEAATDLRKLHKKLELFPSCHLGMWTNGQEVFFVRAEDTTFETRFTNIGAWPAPGEQTDDVMREGGATQVAADPEDLEAALGRCHTYLTKNLNLGGDAFKPLGALLLAKLYDETRPTGERKFWIKGDEPFTAEGQQAIQERIATCMEEAKQWQPSLLRHDWGLEHFDAPSELARVVTELARYSFADSLPKGRTFAFRSGARSTMDGKEGRYPTPLNVAEMAVEMLDPSSEERVFDCSCGTGTFLATAATHVFDRILGGMGVTPHSATGAQLRDAQAQTAAWAHDHLFGCDMTPALAVTTRLNLLLTAGDPGNIFRIDARTFPDGELEDLERAADLAPDESMDIVLTNPWFSTKDTINDEAILRRYDLGKIWNQTDEGHFVNTGEIKTAGVPPEVIFLERAWRWAKPGTGRIAILLPDGLLGNPSDEYVRAWILRHCEVLASVDLPIEPFKVTLKDYRLTPALPSLLVLRRRSDEELLHTTHPDYWVFMAVVNRAGVDARGKQLFQRAPDGEELVFDDEVIERIRIGGRVESKTVKRRQRHTDDELPIVAEHYRKFVAAGRTGT